MRMRYRWILFAALVALAACDNNDKACSCKQQIVVNISVNANEWKYTNVAGYNNNYFYVGVDMPEITAKVFDKGEVQAYAVFDRNSTTAARQHLLPYVMHYEEERDSAWNVYTETYDATYGIGWIEFNYRASDFAYEDDVTINPPAMDFRVVITTPAP